MRSRFIGGILLIVGTSIGGGMLALPITNATIGFWQSTLLLIFSWAVMTLGAFFILEVNLYLPRGTHMVSMAYKTMGKPGLAIAWISNLFLLYALLCAYISGGGDVMHEWLAALQLRLSTSQSCVLFTLLFGLIVYSGIRQVDQLNRALMFIKLGIYALVLGFMIQHIEVNNLLVEPTRALTSSLMLIITSFGFAIIVPNLRDYFNDDIPTLRRLIWVGSLIPLVCYLGWDLAIIGSLPSQGKDGLGALLTVDNPTTALAHAVSVKINNYKISFLFHAFTSICMLTAFLGVSLCLISFLADGLRIEKKGKRGVLLFLLTFLPPCLIVIYYPGAYISALNYAGYFCIVLLLLLPAMMSFFGRKHASNFTVPGGTITQLGTILAGLLIILFSIHSFQ